jgi:cysteine desulfurase/selenocysteine lyase
VTAGLEYLEKVGMDRVEEHDRALTARALDTLASIPGVTIYGPREAKGRGAVVAFSVAGIHPHDAAALLDAEGIAVRAGHHCAQPLMRRLGVVGTIRASFSVFNSPEEIDVLGDAVSRLNESL